MNLGPTTPRHPVLAGVDCPHPVYPLFLGWVLGLVFFSQEARGLGDRWVTKILNDSWVRV